MGSPQEEPMIRVLSLTLVLLLVLAACESRPPINVWGHKDSTSKNLNVGIPF